MPKVHGRTTKVYVNGIDLSTWFRQADIAAMIDIAPTDAFGDTDKSVVVGLKDGNIKLDGFYDNTSGTVSADAVMTSLKAATISPILSVVHLSGINEAGTSMVGALTGYSMNAPIAGVVTMSAEFHANGTGSDRTRTVMSYGTVTPTAPFGTTSQYNGGTATAQGATGYLQAFTVLAGTPVVVIEHSANGSSGWAALITFAAMPLAASAPQAQKVTVTGNVNAFLRASVTGGSAVAYIGINQPKA